MAKNKTATEAVANETATEAAAGAGEEGDHVTDGADTGGAAAAADNPVDHSAADTAGADASAAAAAAVDPAAASETADGDGQAGAGNAAGAPDPAAPAPPARETRIVTAPVTRDMQHQQSGLTMKLFRNVVDFSKLQDLQPGDRVVALEIPALHDIVSVKIKCDEDFVDTGCDLDIGDLENPQLFGSIYIDELDDWIPGSFKPKKIILTLYQYDDVVPKTGTVTVIVTAAH